MTVEAERTNSAKREPLDQNHDVESRPGPYLLQEILDCIVDLLRDEPKTLKQCCLVSKSWVPRTRTHLFSDIEFRSPDGLEVWKKIFPDPVCSPACHTHSLFVGSLQAVTAADAEEGGWIRTFSNVVRLDVRSGIINMSESPGSLVPFHDFSPALKSPRVISRSLSSSQVFNLICSLPLLEDLSIRSHEMGSSDDDGTVFQPSTSAVLTGTLAHCSVYALRVLSKDREVL
ncbi:hypothetical protein BDM02DRAFT_3190265 [Thelephora ganbajun]|uniref:Uncharacterized protein n=1 Tax=Thelephora ganbajun TaxID=370292 RepID=A0ACB6Z5L4_THEGA|nr:hypothetical protein BDM02DRAFT_3190265 [Thelephora ganbajun]